MRKANLYLLKRIPVYALLSVASIIMLLPLFWMVRSSLMDMAQIFTVPHILIPDPFRFENFVQAMTIVPFGRYFLNTLFVLVFTLAGVVLSSSLCAYSFSRIKWTGRDLIFGILMTGMMLPYAVTMIPTFLGWRYIIGPNSFLPLILPAWFGGGMFNIFLLRQFMMSIPKELDEAACIDGAGHFRIFSQIVFPLSRSAVIVIALFTFLNVWNDFLGPLIYLNDQSQFTLAIGIQQFVGSYTAQWHLLMAAATVVTLPPVIAFLVGQKYLLEGIVLTGLK